jgi:hypothetical protein
MYSRSHTCGIMVLGWLFNLFRASSAFYVSLSVVMACSSLVFGRVSWFPASVGVLILGIGFSFWVVVVLVRCWLCWGSCLGIPWGSGIHLLGLVMFVLSSEWILSSSVEFHFLIVFYKYGIGDPSPRTGWWGFSGCWLLNTEMDPNWSEIKRILRRHEEISQANNSALQLILIKLGEMDQAMVSLRNLLEIQTR